MGRNAAAALPPTRAYAQEAKFFCRGRFKTVPHRFTLQQACPVLDTGKNEGNPAKPETGERFSVACWRKGGARELLINLYGGAIKEDRG